MGKKLLFCDVDGVLHPLPPLAQMASATLFSPPCMAQLKRVIKETGAQIILSSSWRCFEGTRNQLAVALGQHGLHVADCTPIPDLGDGRAGQILRYLQQHGDEVESWAVVDDEEVVQGEGLMMQVLAQNFVRTNGATGISVSDADQLIEILNSDNG
uniref:Trehalose 6-phosphate phosphatase n=1 Tax=Dunaliella tertiolecta TaxID=3047 RepID=A0A7S3QKT7_DUNTE